MSAEKKTEPKANPMQPLLDRAEELAIRFIQAEGIQEPMERRNAYKSACTDLASFSEETRLERTEEVSDAINFAYGEQARVRKSCQKPAGPIVEVTGPEQEIEDPAVLKAIKSIEFRIKTMGSNPKLQYNIGRDMMSLGIKRVNGNRVRTVDYYHPTLNALWQVFLATKAKNNGQKLRDYDSMSEAEKAEINLEALTNSVANSLENLAKRESQYGKLHNVEVK